MGFLQFILLLIGNMSLWGCLCGYGPSLAMHWLFRIDPGLLFFLGTGVGIIIGLLRTFHSAQEGMEAWQPATWIGIVMGVALFWVLRPMTFAVFIPWWWVWAMPLAASGMLGGIAGRYLWPLAQEWLKRKQKRKKTIPFCKPGTKITSR